MFNQFHRRRSDWNSGGTNNERQKWVGAEWRGVSGGVSPLQPTRGSVEPRELPQRGPGQLWVDIPKVPYSEVSLSLTLTLTLTLTLPTLLTLK